MNLFREVGMNGDWLAVLLFLGMPVTIALLLFAGFLQWLRHREFMLLLSKGVIDPAAVPARRGSDPLRWAVVLLSAGIGISLGLWPIGLANPQAPYGLTPWMMLGAVPAAIALGLLILHAMSGNPASNRKPEA
jgi:hypothetical protein